MTTLPATVEAATLARLEDLAERAKERLAQSRAPNTITAYQSDMRHFSAWCERLGLPALPTTSDVLVLYLIDHEDTLKPSTLGRRLSAIRRIHDVNGHPNPISGTVTEMLSAVRREKGSRQHQAAALSTDDLRAAIGSLDLDHPRGMRDRAVLLIGFAGGFRRSEIAGFDVADVTDDPKGLLFLIRKSKGDQEGHGQEVGIEYGEHLDTCPVRSLRAWLTAAGITEGPLFRPVTHSGRIGEERISTKTINRITKQAAVAAGLDPGDYSAHSLRAGLVTQALREGVRDVDVMRHTRHKSLDTTRGYARATIWEHNPSGALGL